MELLYTAAHFIAAHAGIFLLLLALMNLFTFILYAVDKIKAKRGKWRISEATLIGFAFAGGSAGAFLGMQLMRHKTQHTKFVLLVPLALVLHIVIITAVVILSHR